jgi:hypothetical protein
LNAHGASRVVVVKETGTKMPADLGGIIYLTLEDRSEWQDTAKDGSGIIAQTNV